MHQIAEYHTFFNGLYNCFIPEQSIYILPDIVIRRGRFNGLDRCPQSRIVGSSCKDHFWRTGLGNGDLGFILK